jgi:hypothetical protein
MRPRPGLTRLRLCRMCSTRSLWRRNHAQVDAPVEAPSADAETYAVVEQDDGEGEGEGDDEDHTEPESEAEADEAEEGRTWTWMTEMRIRICRWTRICGRSGRYRR